MTVYSSSEPHAASSPAEPPLTHEEEIHLNYHSDKEFLHLELCRVQALLVHFYRAHREYAAQNHLTAVLSDAYALAHVIRTYNSLIQNV